MSSDLEKSPTIFAYNLTGKLFDHITEEGRLSHDGVSLIIRNETIKYLAKVRDVKIFENEINSSGLGNMMGGLK